MSNQIVKIERGDYLWATEITTRWMDNDIYAHVNNVVYYSWFDTVVNQYLLENEVLDPVNGKVVGLVVETQCNYFAPISFPDRICASLRVAYIGKSSVRYEVGIFRNNERNASAQGHFVHVYVDSQNRKPCPIPEELKSALLKIQSTE